MGTDGLHLGIDVGTQGVRAVLVAADGSVVGRSSHALAALAPGPVQEQAPDDWWTAVVAAVTDLGAARPRVERVAISCTSGTVCALDAAGNPIAPALLYADTRAVPRVGADASWAVAKLGWLAAEAPDLVARAATFTSPGGFLASRLLGGSAPIDDTQALKFGFDPGRRAWGPLPIDEAQVPIVVRTGAVLGPVGAAAAEVTGLSTDALVVAGATDGVAAQFACRPAGDRWAVSIGSTVVWKAVSARRIDAPAEGIYSHRGPGDRWLPGAASFAGARVFAEWATPAELVAFDADADAVPTPATDAAYPSTVVGERFPFADPTFRPWSAAAGSGPERYAAEVLGVAFVERWGCEVLVARGCERPTSVATTGGATASRTWMRLRADVLGVPIEVPAEPSAAFGAAVIAAGDRHGGIMEAGAAMVRVAERFEPTAEPARWDDAYGRFRERCVGTEGAA